MVEKVTMLVTERQHVRNTKVECNNSTSLRNIRQQSYVTEVLATLPQKLLYGKADILGTF